MEWIVVVRLVDVLLDPLRNSPEGSLASGSLGTVVRIKVGGVVVWLVMQASLMT